MGSILFLVAAYTVLVVLPFKKAATWIGAERDDWFTCFFAVLVAGILGGGVSGVIGSVLSIGLMGTRLGLISLAIVLLVSGVTNRFILGTTVVRGMLITFIGAVVIPGALIAGLMLGARMFAS